MRRVCALMLALAPIVLAVGCASNPHQDQVLDELANLDKATIFDRAEALYQDGKYERARKYFSFLYDTFPNDPLGHKAALRIADTYIARKDSMSLTEARLRYRDFTNRYPNDPDRDYALLMLGQTYTARKTHPDRDLTSLAESLSAFRQLVNIYPDSPYVEQAREEMHAVRENLAEHELMVARFYLRNRRWLGAQWRLEYLKENYPEYSKMEEVDIALDRCQKEVAARKAELEQRLAEQKAKGKR